MIPSASRFRGGLRRRRSPGIARPKKKEYSESSRSSRTHFRSSGISIRASGRHSRLFRKNGNDLLFRHALALYDYDGTYLGVWTPLTLAAEGIDPEIATFQLMPPRIDPPLPGIEPPAPPVMSAVPSLSRAHFLWLRDSAGVIVAASFPVADDPQADWTPRAWTLTWSPPGESDGELRFSVSARTEVPDEPYQGPGRAFTADGRLLVSRYDSRGDVFALDYHELAEGWAPFGERETISVNDAWWVF
jgi:hypothetical protein